jgi:hypothetical protein
MVSRIIRNVGFHLFLQNYLIINISELGMNIDSFQIFY